MNRQKKWKIIRILTIVLVVVHFYMLIVMLQHTRYEQSFNCVNFTSEAINYFDKLGVKAYQVTGIDKATGTGHSWVCVKPFGYILHYEPQEFMFFYPIGNIATFGLTTILTRGVGNEKEETCHLRRRRHSVDYVVMKGKYASKEMISSIRLIVDYLDKKHKLEDDKTVSYALFRLKKWLNER